MADTASYPIQSLLAVDFGSVTTRAALFDVVESSYRFVACGEAPSTLMPPFLDVLEGLRHAVEALQVITGRTMLDAHAHLTVPTDADGIGVDVLVATASGGPALRGLLVGLLPDVSLESARRIANSSYVQVLDTFSLADQRRQEQQLDAVLKAQPEVIILAGGADDGARDALLKMVDTLSLAGSLLPTAGQTQVLYAGNAALHEKITAVLGEVAQVHLAANAQPVLGQEVLGPARAALIDIFNQIRARQFSGFAEIANAAGGRVHPTAQAAAQTIRYLSEMLKAAGGVLGVDLGASATTLAATFHGDLVLDVRSDLGLGLSAAGVLAQSSLEQFQHWLPFEISDADLRDFIYNKTLHPQTIPADARDMHLELALAREAIRAALRQARLRWPKEVQSSRGDLLPWFDLIVASGAVFSRAPRPGLAAMLILDALLPTAVTTIFLDPHHLAAALGAAAYANPLAVVQAVEGGAFVNLGMAISVMGRARPDQVVCQAKLTSDSGEQSLEIKAGTLKFLPLAPGQEGKLVLKPLAGQDVGFGPGRGKTVPVIGGQAGVIIDARGRPLIFPAETGLRRQAVQEWTLQAGGLL